MKLPILPKMPVTRSYKAATASRDHCEAASGDLAHCGPTSGTHLGYNLERPCRWCRINRQGAAAVEFALVAPLFFAMIIGMIEAGRAIMVQQIITNASREGAREAVLYMESRSETGAAADGEAKALEYLGNAEISGGSANAVIETDENGDRKVIVTVQVPYSSVSWVPTWFFQENMLLSASAVMRLETE